MNKLIFIIALTIISNVFAFAQTTDDYKKGEFFAGYSSSTNLDEGGRLYGTVRGFNVSGVYNVHRYIGIKGDVSAAFSRSQTIRFFSLINPEISYKERRSIANYVGGVQFKNNSSDATVKPFAHILVGAGQFRNKITNTICPANTNCSFIPISETNTGFSTIVGGGLDVKLNDKVDVRLIQIDINRISYEDSFNYNTRINTVRFGAGIVFK